MKNNLIRILIVMILTVGTVSATEITASNLIPYSNDIDTSTIETAYNTSNPTKEILMMDSYTGSWRVTYELKSVYGTPVKAKFCDYQGKCTTERVTSSTTWQTFIEDIQGISVIKGDKPYVVAASMIYGNDVVVRNLRIGFSWASIATPTPSPSPTPTPSPTPSPSPIPTATPTGSILFTVKDINDNYLPGVAIQPTGAVTNEYGQYILDNQPLNQPLNFILTKSPYVNNYTQIILTNSTRLPQVFVMRRSGDMIRQFKVTGWEDFVIAGTMSYLRVKDSVTDESIDGAKVILFNGNTVKSIPGNTTAGRVTVSFTEAGYYELVIEKSGYEDWGESIRVMAAPTPTITSTLSPTPAPAPTVNKIFRPDVGTAITDDEYRAWLEVKEKERATQNNTPAAATIPPYLPPSPPESYKIPYSLIAVLSLIVVGGVYYKTQNQKSPPQTDEDIIDHVGRDRQEPTDPDNKKTITITCDKCEHWTKEIPADSSPEIIKLYKDEHIKSHKGG